MFERTAPNLNVVSSPDVPLTLGRDDFDLDRVKGLKGTTTVAVVIPAKNESATIGTVLEAAKAHPELVDELVVVNDYSVDDTTTVADHHGARVVALEGPSGKGEAMRAGVPPISTSWSLASSMLRVRAFWKVIMISTAEVARPIALFGTMLPAVDGTMISGPRSPIR